MGVGDQAAGGTLVQSISEGGWFIKVSAWRSVIILELNVVGACSRLKQHLKFVKFNFAGSVLIDRLNQLLNINGHLKLLLDRSDQLVRID